jgi:hypothetical protein
MNNPTVWIYVFCCGAPLIPIGLGLLTYRIMLRLATRQPVLIVKKEKGKTIVMLEIREHEPMAKEEKEND